MKQLERTPKTVHVSKLINLDTFRLVAETPIDDVVQRKDYNERIDFKAFPVDADDEVDEGG